MALRAIYLVLLVGLFVMGGAAPARAGTSLSFPVTFSEAVNVTGTPRLVLDVGGVTRYATYAAGTASATLTFTYTTQAGDLDLDGVTVSSSLDLNGGAIADLNGNALSPLTFSVPDTSAVKVAHPSLSLDFVGSDYILNGTHYGSLSSFLTAASGLFNRGSTGTYFDSSGTLQSAPVNTPRFDFDPVTHVAKGLLIEESRINYARASDALDNATYWNKTGTVAPIIIANAALAPDGTMSAEEIDLSPAGDTRPNQVNDIPGAINQSASTFSVWLRAKTTPGTIYLAGRQADGLIVAVAANVTMSWQRFSLNIPASTGAMTGLVYVGHRGFGGTCLNYYAWGAQHELGAFPTSYIPTTTATVTRAADSLTIPVGAWFNSSEGAFSARTSTLYSSAADSASIRDVLRIHDGTGNNFHRLFQYRAKYGGSTMTGGALQADLQTGTVVAGTSYGLGYSYGLNNFQTALDGALSANDSSGTLPAVSTLSIGGTSALNGAIERLKYYPLHPAHGQLQLLTQ